MPGNDSLPVPLWHIASTWNYLYLEACRRIRCGRRELDSEVEDVVATESRITGRTIMLFLCALLSPLIVGYQYLEWYTPSSSHVTWFIATGIGMFEFSDWAESGWFLRLDSSLLFLPTQLLFAAAVWLYTNRRVSRAYVVGASLPLLALTAILSLELLTANTIFGVPPGVFISIAAPDVDSRLILPVPLLLLIGILFIIRGNQ